MLASGFGGQEEEEDGGEYGGEVEAEADKAEAETQAPAAPASASPKKDKAVPQRVPTPCKLSYTHQPHNKSGKEWEEDEEGSTHHATLMVDHIPAPKKATAPASSPQGPPATTDGANHAAKPLTEEEKKKLRADRFGTSPINHHQTPI